MPSSVLAARELIDSSVRSSKPDVIFAHSEGGAAVLSALLHNEFDLKCLVLVSCSPPFDSSGQRRLDFSVAGAPIHIPTISVRGDGDPLGHFANLAEGLVDKSNLTTFSWRGGHEVPNSSEGSLWAQIAQRLVEITNK